ncbi:MAG: DUF3800 domain-containing protein [Thermoplasmata archaeon]|nr:DUF3800 domain-containing protein [Thermoplasmata archaeon]
MASICIFIDESGNPFANEIAFSTAAVWCVQAPSSRRDKPLSSTVDSLKQYLIDDHKVKWAREIHHRGMPDEFAEFLLFMAMNKARTDPTIQKEGCFWDRSPVRFTMSIDNPCAFKLLNPEIDSQKLGNLIRLSALGNLLRPLCICQNTEKILADIILDAEIWKSAIDRYDPYLKRTIDNPSIETRLYYSKSAKTPGLQIADLAAGIIRQHHLKSTQNAGYKLLLSNELVQIKFNLNR